jgi:hypothetical protein
MAPMCSCDQAVREEKGEDSSGGDMKDRPSYGMSKWHIWPYDLLICLSISCVSINLTRTGFRCRNSCFVVPDLSPELHFAAADKRKLMARWLPAIVCLKSTAYNPPYKVFEVVAIL